MLATRDQLARQRGGVVWGFQLAQFKCNLKKCKKDGQGQNRDISNRCKIALAQPQIACKLKLKR